MIEIEGKLFKHNVSILIDLGACLSYVSPKAVELCQLQTHKFKIPWLVQLEIGVKRRVVAKVENGLVELVDQPIKVDLNVFPPGLMMF